MSFALLMVPRSFGAVVLAAVFSGALALGASGCSTHAPAALAVDTPLVPYQAPDIDELTGADMEDSAAPAEEAPTAEPAPPAPAAATPGAPKAGR